MRDSADYRISWLSLPELCSLSVLLANAVEMAELAELLSFTSHVRCTLFSCHYFAREIQKFQKLFGARPK
jgi:hypothetical protein